MNRLNKLGHTEPYQPLREDRWELFALNLSEGKSIPQSYIDAGYSRNKSTAKVCGARLLAKPIVKARVAYLENNCHLSREELLALLARCARSATSSLKDRISAGQECSRMMGWNRGPKAEPAKVGKGVVMGGPEWDLMLAAATQAAVARLDGDSIETVGPEPVPRVGLPSEPEVMEDW